MRGRSKKYKQKAQDIEAQDLISWYEKYDDNCIFLWLLICRLVIDFPFPTVDIKHKKIPDDYLLFSQLRSNKVIQENFKFFHLAEEIDLAKRKYNLIVNYHIRNLFWGSWFLFLIFWLLGFSIFLLINNYLYQDAILLNIFLLSFVTTVYPLIVIRLFWRIVGFLIPESLCVMHIILLNFDLCLVDKDVFSRPVVKSIILWRMDYLAKTTELLASHYAFWNRTNRKWILKQFKSINNYILERQRWFIFPQENTLQDLREDFACLAKFYLNGKYGSFNCQSYEETERSGLKFQENFWVNLGKFLGIIFPLVVMIFFINVDQNLSDSARTTIIYLAFAWVLVVIDIKLKLGVLESLLKLINGLRDLNG